ncbi:MAG: hypothetical protein AAGI30_14075 [Planctomycetota bacterium]
MASTREAGNIEVHEAYEYASPSTGVDPANARWDPGFNADFTTASSPGHTSYAHLRPAQAGQEMGRARRTLR